MFHSPDVREHIGTASSWHGTTSERFASLCFHGHSQPGNTEWLGEELSVLTVHSPDITLQHLILHPNYLSISFLFGSKSPTQAMLLQSNSADTTKGSALRRTVFLKTCNTSVRHLPKGHKVETISCKYQILDPYSRTGNMLMKYVCVKVSNNY